MKRIVSIAVLGFICLVFLTSCFKSTSKSNQLQVVATTGMIADLVEDAEVRTNKRSEGVFFASVTFIRKTTQGIGVVAAGLLLTYSEFPEGVTPDQVPVSVVHDLATIYVPVVILLWSLMILCISMYQVDRTKHEENLQTLGRG